MVAIKWSQAPATGEGMTAGIRAREEIRIKPPDRWRATARFRCDRDRRGGRGAWGGGKLARGALKSRRGLNDPVAIGIDGLIQPAAGWAADGGAVSGLGGGIGDFDNGST